jgi:hypothetical protein
MMRSLAVTRQLDQRKRQALGRPTVMHIERMHRQAAMNRQRLPGLDRSREPQARDASDLGKRFLLFANRIIAQSPCKGVEDRILGATARANDERQAELFLVGIVQPFEHQEFDLRQAVEPGAVLLARRVRGQARGTLGLVGEIGMRAEQREPLCGRGHLDRGDHGIAQGGEVGERPARRGSIGDPV